MNNLLIKLIISQIAKQTNMKIIFIKLNEKWQNENDYYEIKLEGNDIENHKNAYDCYYNKKK